MREELIKLFKEGNKQAGDDFYKANIGLTFRAFRKCNIYSIDKEEKFALINQAFAKAMINFDISKGEFSTYFMKLARGHILTYCRDLANIIKTSRKDFLENKVTIGCDSLEKVIFESEAEDVCLKDMLGTEVDFSGAFVHETLKNLEKIDRDVFNLYFLKDYNQKEIAKILNLSGSAVSRSLSKSKTKLRVILKEVS